LAARTRRELNYDTRTLTTELLDHRPEGAKKKESTLKPAMKTAALTPELLAKMNAYWRAANYVSVGQIYLYENPLLKEPLKLSHVKPLVVAALGTCGSNHLRRHLNRVIKKYDLNMFYIAGPATAAAGGQRLPRRHLERGLSMSRKTKRE